MQILNQTQNSSAGYGLSETLMAQTQLQLQAVGNTSSAKPSGNGDPVTLSSGALTGSGANGQNNSMSSLLSMMESILQQVLGTSLTAVAATPQANATATGKQGNTDQNSPSSPLNQLTDSILSALQGDNSGQAAQSGGNQNSLLSALSSMGNSVQNDALSLFNNLSSQNQSMMNGLVSNAAAQGASGSYESQVSVAESESYSFTASGQLTTASGQTYQFSLQVELQANVAIASTQSGTFGPNSQNGSTQSQQLGQQAGLLAGANLNYNLSNLLKSSTGGSATNAQADNTDQSAGSDTSTGNTGAADQGDRSAVPTTSSIGQEITSALASLTLTPQNAKSTQTPLQQQVSALFHRKHGHHHTHGTQGQSSGAQGAATTANGNQIDTNGVQPTHSSSALNSTGA